MIRKGEIPFGDKRDPVRNHEPELGMDPDVAHELALMKIVDPEVLIEKLSREARERADENSEFVVPMINLMKRFYGDKPRKLSETLSILHPLRIAQANPSEEELSSTEVLIRLGHDLVEVHHLPPGVLSVFGGEDVVAGVTALTQTIEETYAEYLEKIKIFDKLYPKLGLKRSKARDIMNNSGDPVGLPASFVRHENTVGKMTHMLDKYDTNLHHLFDPDEVLTPKIRTMISLGRQGAAHPQLLIPKAA
jgi:hypothetical protein